MLPPPHHHHQVLYIQMEFCPRTLSSVLEAGGLEEADAWGVLRGILAGLAYIHSQVGVGGGGVSGSEQIKAGRCHQARPARCTASPTASRRAHDIEHPGTVHVPTASLFACALPPEQYPPLPFSPCCQHTTLPAYTTIRLLLHLSKPAHHHK